MKRFKMFLRLGIILILPSVVFALVPSEAEGAIPNQMNFQGILTDSGGTALDDTTVSVEFRIYTTIVGGISKWVETQSVSTDDQGRFNVLLGVVTPIEDTVFNDTVRYLGVKVGADAELAPRTKLVSVAYSNRVSTVDGATGGLITGETVVKGAGANDKIALGVSDPNIALELRSGTFGGNPYIDFSNDDTADFDARLQLDGDAGLEITVDSKLTIPTGNVGIGTTGPTSTFHLVSSATGTTDMAQWFSGAQVRLRLRGNGSAVWNVNDGAVEQGQVVITTPGGTPGFQFFDESALSRSDFRLIDGGGFIWGAHALTTAPPERMRLTAAGNLGIGTTSPGYKLEVSGPVMMEDASPPFSAGGHSGVYSSGGELFAIDAAGNTTQLSPHDPETGEWIFYSKNINTGRVVKVDMERMIRKIEELTGEKFMVEEWEK